MRNNQATAEGLRQAPDAATKDGMVYSKPWEFQVEAITFEHLFQWQGEQDRVMPTAAARLLAQALPHCTATFYPNEGHLSTFVNHVEVIWKALSAPHRVALLGRGDPTGRMLPCHTWTRCRSSSSSR